MNDALSQLLTGAVGGAIITSLIAPYINRTSERRKNRAAVMQAITQVEVDRWAGPNGASYIDFQKSVVNLKATAMIAGAIDARVVDEYIRVARVARAASDDDATGAKKTDRFAGSITTSLSDLASSAAEQLIAYVATPYWRRRFDRSTLRTMKDATARFRRTKDGKQTEAEWWK